nr:transposase (putative), gypsy type [Tanacetum cinerariifolium]
GRSLCFVLEMRNNVMPPDTYSVQAPSGGVTDWYQEPSEPKWDPDQAGSACDRDLRTLVPFHGCLLVRGSITDIKYVLTQRALIIFYETYHIPDEVHPQLPSPNQTIHEMPSGKIGVYTSKGVPKEPFPKSSEFNAEHYATLVALSAPFHKYPELFLCLVGISRYYTLDEYAYPEFLGDNDEGMDLLAFIRTADPTKVRVAKRQRAKNKPRLLESTVGRVVPLLPIAPARASSEMEASVDKLFDEGASGDGQDADVQPAVVTTDTIVEDVAPLQPRRQRKRKTVVTDVGGPSHPPKKLREDFGDLDRVFTAATPEREDRSPADSVPGLNPRTIGAPQRFVISSESSHYSGVNIAKAEVDSIIRSSALAIATVTTVTAAIDTEATATRAPVAPSLFGVGSSSTGRTDSVPGGFSDVSVSDFLIVGIRIVVDLDSDLQKVYVPRWSVTNGFRLDDSCIYREIEKRKLRAVVDEQAELLKTKDEEIESLKAQLLLKEAEAAEAIRLRAEVFRFESAEQSLRSEVGFLRDQNIALEREKNELDVKVTDLSASVKVREQEVADLDAQVTAVKLQNDNLVGQVHELETSFAGLQEKVAAYEGFVSQLEKFQDEKLEEVNEKFDKLCADFVEMALHLEEKFYPHTISGRRWLLTYGMELAVAKCLNSTEYLSSLGAAISKAVEKGMQEGLSAGTALGAAISKAVEKGMQEGLSAGITHGTEGRQLADVAAYNPSAEADYLSALQHLQSVNFSLIAELKSNKDASVDTIMNLIRLDDVLAERLGLIESQPHVDQLMVPIHHSPDQRVVGASAITFSLEVSHSRVKKMKENIANHRSALRGMFVPLSEPLSATTLEGMEGTSGSTHDAAATLSTTFVSSSTIPPISTDDYEVAHADGQGGARVDDEAAADDDINLFVSNADLNISE